MSSGLRRISEAPLCAARVAVWVDAVLTGTAAPDDLPASLGAARGGWIDVLATARREHVDGVCLRLPRPGDSRGITALPRRATEEGAAVALTRDGRPVLWLIRGPHGIWDQIDCASAGAMPVHELQDADRRLRRALLDAVNDLESLDVVVSDAEGQRALASATDAWEGLDFPYAFPGDQRRLLARAVPLFLATGISRMRPDAGVTLHESVAHRHALDDLGDAARAAIEAGCSSNPRR